MERGDEESHRVKLLGEEPVDVAAGFADETDGGGVGPIDVEEAGGGGVELRLATVEFVVAADLAFEDVAVDFVGLGFGFGEESHGASMTRAGGAARLQTGMNIGRRSGEYADLFFRLFGARCGAKFAVRR
jgi:hypothetical protein